MEQQIRFCTSADGTRIAYATLGEGPPLVYITGWGLALQPSQSMKLVAAGVGPDSKVKP